MLCIIFLYEQFKNYSRQSFTESLFFIFCLFSFLLLSNNTLHVMFYIYICYLYLYLLLKRISIQKPYFSCRKTISCATDFKRYLFTLYHIIYLPISVLSRLHFISRSFPRVQLHLKILKKLKQSIQKRKDKKLFVFGVVLKKGQ